MNQTIRDYALTQWLGSGGMGEVYLAQHGASGRTVALKLLRQAGQADRFRNEAAVQASLRHPHIARLYDFFEEGGLSCLVLEYVEGPTLEQFIRKNGPFTEPAAWKLLGQVASAMAFLHEQHIIHRDLKAGNVKLNRQGDAKLLDFGLARNAKAERLTRQGYLIGTTASMAPEQFVGESAPPADCWALGVLLYEMLTGHAPFGGRTDTETTRRIQRADYRPIRQLKPNLARTSERLIEGLLTVNPTHRLTAPQVLDLLQNPTQMTTADWSRQVLTWWNKHKP